jgi:hypothetical protein
MIKKSFLMLYAALMAAPATAWAANPLLSGTYILHETVECFGTGSVGAYAYSGILNMYPSGAISGSMVEDYASQGNSIGNGMLGGVGGTYTTTPSTLTISLNGNPILPNNTASAFFGYPGASGYSNTVSFSSASDNGSSPCLYSGTLTQ